jgi:hypothetical protein
MVTKPHNKVLAYAKSERESVKIRFFFPMTKIAITYRFQHLGLR